MLLEFTKNSFNGMKQRCFNPSATYFSEYGGRGIKVCAGLLEFEDFIFVLGHRPSLDFSLDRKDVNGNYSCGECFECFANDWVLNVRWASQQDQCNNRRTNILVSYCGFEGTLQEVADYFNMDARTLKLHLDNPNRNFQNQNHSNRAEIIIYCGIGKSKKDWASFLGMRYSTFRSKFSRGHNIENLVREKLNAA